MHTEKVTIHDLQVGDIVRVDYLRILIDRPTFVVRTTRHGETRKTFGYVLNPEVVTDTNDSDRKVRDILASDGNRFPIQSNGRTRIIREVK